MAWSDIPTCKEAGVDVEYRMLRGIFMSSGVEQEHVDFYVDLLNGVVKTPEWTEFMKQGAFNQTVMTGSMYRSWLEAAEKQHFELMKEAGFLAEMK
jgi:tripartite-type tricarboxylate transporter receptor subunit TctC